MSSELEKKDNFAALDGRKASTISQDGTITVESPKDADEALNFLENHPRSAEIALEVRHIAARLCIPSSAPLLDLRALSS